MKQFYFFCWYFCLGVVFTYGQKSYYEKKRDAFVANYRYDSAAVYAQKAVRFYNQNSDHLAENFLKGAKIFKSLSKTDSCVYYLNKAENLFKQSTDLKYKQEKLFNILVLKAELARFSNRKELATKYINQATKSVKPDFDFDVLAYYYNRRMAIVSQFYNYDSDSVKTIHLLADKIIINQDRITDKSIPVYTLNEIGFLDFNKNPKKALEYFNQAFLIAKKSNAKQALIDVAINLGRTYQQKFLDQDKAIYYHKIALETATEIDNLWQKYQATINLRICYSLKNDFETALTYSDQATVFAVEMEKKDKNILLNEMEKKYNFQAKESELKSSKKNTLYLLILLVSLLAVLGIMFFYNRKIKFKNIELSKLSSENEFLVSETNHRVNNNLQLIAYLISEVLRKKQNGEDKNEFIKLLSKVEAIATLHRHLYLTKNKKNLNLQKYFKELQINFESVGIEENIVLDFEVDKIEIHSDQAVHLGLLLSELYINSIKHAFSPNQEKRIRFHLLEKDGILSFNYEDNGENAIGKEIQPKLVDQLCLQLEVIYSITTKEGFKLCFSKDIASWI